MQATTREKNIIKVMQKLWDSLDSHAKEILYPPKMPTKVRKRIGGKGFDKKCIREYADSIKKLADIL